MRIYYFFNKNLFFKKLSQKQNYNLNNNLIIVKLHFNLKLTQASFNDNQRTHT
jgi:hypothetical protein